MISTFIQQNDVKRRLQNGIYFASIGLQEVNQLAPGRSKWNLDK